ncbi:MAG TPA: translation elongation factor 4, partial [Candidatus Acidoferrales bacterium]|nr:translation elongation factor 4 [Candidatus Acidoferrales bacterium]
MTIPQDRLRNFSIIAHIDHGKSTLADRLLELTHTIDARQMTSQVLDSMDLEREKGITIKARAVRLEYQAKDGLTYGLNLIDTPGHVDFAYEVSHSLQACEGAILVVDATQGIEAQTLANVHLALREGLTLIPVLNKIDLPSAQPEVVMEELETVLAIPREEVILASAKEGTGVPEILEAIVARIPPPKGDPNERLQALVFDSHYDQYKGVIVYVRLAQGTLHDHDRVRLMASGAEAELLELGVFRPQLVPVETLVAGEVGYVATGLKNVREAQVGDTITSASEPALEPLPGYQEAKSLVFAGIYPVSGEDYPLLRDAIEKLHLNDASFTYEPESSVALGFGFRCGFLGLLH